MKPLLASVDAVLFDLDGTLVETNIDFARMRQEMTDLAVSAGIDERELRGLDILAIVEYAAKALGKRGKRARADELRRRAMSVLEEIEVHHAGQAAEIPFARQILGALSERGIRSGIVTRNCRRASLMAMQAAGIEPEVLVCREDTARHKPYPDPLRLALRSLGARPPASIMVGDHLMDIQGGKAAGMATIGFLRESRPPDFFADVQPDFTARSLEEVLCAIIGSDR